MSSYISYFLKESKTEERILKSEKEKEKAEEFFKKNDYELAIFFYSRGIQLNPENPILYRDRARAYSKIGRNEDSLADLEKAKNLEKKDTNAYLQLYHAYTSINDEINAQRYLQLYNQKKSKVLYATPSEEGKKEKEERNEEERDNAEIDRKERDRKERDREVKSKEDRDKEKGGNKTNEQIEENGKGSIKKKEKSIKTSSDLLNLEESENEWKNRKIKINKIDKINANDRKNRKSKNNTNSLFLFNGSSEKEQKEGFFEKRECNDNFLIEEIFDFKENDKKNNFKAEESKKDSSTVFHNNNNRNKEKNEKEKECNINMNDILFDVDIFLTSVKNCFPLNGLISVHIQKENTGDIMKKWEHYDTEILKKKADELYTTKNFHWAIQLYTEVLSRLSSQSIFYCTVLSNKSMCFVETKKIKSALCDISRTMNLLFSFFENHKHIMLTFGSIEEIKKKGNENEKEMHTIDLKIYKTLQGIYNQAHKLLVKSFYRYIKYVHLHKQLFHIPCFCRLTYFLNFEEIVI